MTHTDNVVSLQDYKDRNKYRAVARSLTKLRALREKLLGETEPRPKPSGSTQ